MTPLAADIIGLVGSALFIAAFAYANMVQVIDKVLFNSINLVGAALLLTSLWVNFNLAAFVLETAWALIAAVSLVAALRTRASQRRKVRMEP
ncbi:hypothetical protein V5740_03560 [Croceibacterium sp. TMG7-5b_MA50]|uniref:CBU_0592 family membrane protein n=1 Tax=Croceibacterium sp. TMG7-5b_MA50 TaxID=3121290 RepID=UPI003221705E